jgi:GntR family transcriptional regulator, transcriptional repressor for pyruvate dehydrogenase complex
MQEYRTKLRRKGLRDQLVEHLEETILRHEIAVGAALPSEREMMETWGVSASVVRGAIRTLESRGLVEVRHGIGAIVKADIHEAFDAALGLLIRRDNYQLSELMPARMAIEAEAAIMATQHAVEHDFLTMEQILGDYLQAASEGDFVRARDMDRAFHLSIIEATHNRPFIHLVAPLVRYFLDNTLLLPPYGGTEGVNDVAAHRVVYEAIRTRDGQRAAQLLRAFALVSSQEYTYETGSQRQDL